MEAYSIRGLRKSYAGRVVLDVPALAVRQGELLVVLGPSGAGKSTLLRLMHFLEPPTAGIIAYSHKGVPVHAGGWPVALDVRRRIGMVFQRPEMVHGSVYDNVSLGARFRGAVDPPAVEAALDQVGILPLKNEPVETLSGGELQRAAIARILAYRPEVVLFDEPTANLDPANVALVETLVRDMHRGGATIILVTHNVFQARRLADRVALLLAGELIEVSERETFFHAPEDPRALAFVNGEMVY